jgi:hypothetical protein
MKKPVYNVMAAAGHNARLEITDIMDTPIPMSNELALADALVLYDIIRNEIPWKTFGALINHIIEVYPNGYE